MAEPFKICPICDSANHRNAVVCITCGATLADVPAIETEGDAPAAAGYDFRYGETDLLEDSLRQKARGYLTVIVVVLLLAMTGGLLLAFGPSISRMLPPPAPTLFPTMAGVQAESTVTDPQGGVIFITNTAQPTFVMATVTEGPPTSTATPTASLTPSITPTPTRTPCMQTVQAGEGMYDIIARCGHRDLAVVDLVVEINNLNNEVSIFPNQVLEIPWPTETPDPASFTATPPPTVEESVFINPDTLELVQGRAGSAALNPALEMTPTLPPGLTMHRIAAGENIITIGFQYDTSAEILSQLNPEITFSQCEFGERFGGPRCTVLLQVGQELRVPAPLPTPTLSPTPSGSETPTPSPTATFNAPHPASPSNRAYFRRDEFVTLRWSATGTLAEDEAYLVTLENTTDGTAHTAETGELFFVIPQEWHGRGSGRYEYTWTIGVIAPDNRTEPRYTTQPRAFTWEGLGEDDQ